MAPRCREKTARHRFTRKRITLKSQHTTWQTSYPERKVLFLKWGPVAAPRCRNKGQMNSQLRWWQTSQSSGCSGIQQRGEGTFDWLLLQTVCMMVVQNVMRSESLNRTLSLDWAEALVHSADTLHCVLPNGISCPVIMYTLIMMQVMFSV